MSKILVVDDESGIRNLCYDLFTKDGHEVITVPRGDQLLSMLRPEKPDLVLMDIKIPGEEGLSLLKRMPNARDVRVPVVIFSGYVTQELEKEAYAAGAIEVIRKGIKVAELREKINKILGAKHRIFGEVEDKPSRKILIVDDEDGVRNLLAHFFKRKGFLTLVAKSGEEAISITLEMKPSVVLLDLTMPGMDGILTLKKLKEIDPNLGVVIATAVQDEEIAQEATKCGAYAYVLKPFDLQYLELVVLTRLVIAA